MNKYLKQFFLNIRILIMDSVKCILIYFSTIDKTNLIFNKINIK